MSDEKMKICVYCASSNHVDEKYWAAAKELGELIGEGGHSLVWGGGKVGLMGEVARAAQGKGAKLYGVITETLVDMEISYEEADELLVVETMRERKGLMEEKADAFVALPGGPGTLEELSEILVGRFLKHHEKPIVLVNVNGFYEPFMKLIEHYVKERFAKEKYCDLFKLVDTPEEAIEVVMGFEVVG